MEDILVIQQQIDALHRRLERLLQERDGICEDMIFAGRGATTQTSADLEEIKREAEALRRRLDELTEQRGRLDPDVREASRELDELLNRYYWLWQKCAQQDQRQSEEPDMF
ncbi:aspartyl-phosphate phosphatase Spo0E family protein [Acetonema longum]|uniref:Uncharacterized protein n=1 Tax=Acetonema longum DSM 6540 TaxID=1009370 RepID=F7NJ04_9FIRM|nr:aspartyl-phosphate phosphatase Spo0E family protein [Acetonema longum]EGO64001.1 hypothetical protein ALO_10284 [Acetonema longum DSM 6540]